MFGYHTYDNGQTPCEILDILSVSKDGVLKSKSLFITGSTPIERYLKDINLPTNTIFDPTKVFRKLENVFCNS